MEKMIRRARLLMLVMVANGVLLSGCREDDPNPAPTRMTLSGKLNGDVWEATGFLVQKYAATSASDSSLVIQPYRDGGSTRMYLYVYDVTAPGTYVFDYPSNSRRTNALMERTNPATKAISFLGEGPTTFTFTTVQNGRYVGTFSGKFIDKLGRGSIEVTKGKFDVRLGSQ